MKPIKIKNAHGETVEMKWDAEGRIKIRRSDLNPVYWGELREYAKRMRQPEVKAFLAAKGKQVGVDLSSQEAKELAEKMGGYIVFRGGETFPVDANEIAMIHAAIKQSGGIVPNWESRS